MTLPEASAGVADADLTGTTAFVTGATSGIGRETALALGRLGATVHIHGRNKKRGHALIDELNDQGSESVFYRADFASQTAVRDLATKLSERIDELDVLVNNAGAHFDRGHLVWDDVEATFAVNHLAPFVLTHDLLDTIAQDGRIITTASGVHTRASASDFDGIHSTKNYDGLETYSRSKLANVMFTVELARHLDGPTANCFHPGFVPGSGLWRNASFPVRFGTRLINSLPTTLTKDIADTPKSAARNAVYLVASPEIADVSGAYFDDCERSTPSASATDTLAQRSLWSQSEKLTGVEWT